MISIIIIVKNDRRIVNVLNLLPKISHPEKTEIIVVDASEGILSDIKEKFLHAAVWIPFINMYNKKITIPEQRNVGIQQAKGDIIVFIDSDCVPDTNWLVEITKPIYKDNEHIVAGKVIFSDKNSLHTSSQKVKMKREYLTEAPTMNLAVRKEVFDTVGIFDENFSCGEDVDFCWRARNAGFKIRVHQQAIVFHDLGTIFNEIRRMYSYGKARVNLYIKHSYLQQSFRREMMIILYPLYFLCIPLLWFTIVYPLLLLFPIVKYSKKNPLRVILMKTMYGAGFLKQMVVSI